MKQTRIKVKEAGHSKSDYYSNVLHHEINANHNI